MSENDIEKKVIPAFSEKKLKEISIQNHKTENLDSKKIPQNLEAEASLLGAILFDPSVLENIIDLVKDYYFYEPFHKEIFLACIHFFDKGTNPDPITLSGYLKDTNIKRDTNTLDYLSDLQGGVLSISNAESYAQEIKNCYIRRQLVKISDELILKSLNPSLEISPEEQILQTEELLFNLAERDKTENGPQSFKTTLKSATQLIDEAHKRGKGLPGVDTGFSGLNRFLGGLNKSDLIVLAARPSMGKTALATNIAFKAAKISDEKKEPVLFFSLEMSSEQLAQRILAEQAAIDSHKLRRGEIENNEFSKLVSIQNEIQNLPFFIDDTPALSVSQIASRARRLKRTEGLKLIVIDYIQLLQSKNSRGPEHRVQEVSAITRQLKSVAKELNVPILALSQLSRAVELREDKKPQLADLRESGSIEQDADIVMFIFREEYYLEKAQPVQKENENNDSFHDRFKRWEDRCYDAQGKAEIIISKQRHGPTGRIQLQFESKFTRFLDFIEDTKLPDQTM